MRILVSCHGYPPYHNAGAEVMLRTICRWMAARGHEVEVLTSAAMCPDGPRELDGVRVTPPLPSTAAELERYRETDLVLTHLDHTRLAVERARKVGTPVAHLVHNKIQLGFHRVEPAEADLVIYNSRWLARAVRFSAPSIVLYPPLFPEDYQVERRTAEGSVTLLNLNENKGGQLFWDLARRMPDVPFLGVRGSYGDQCVPDAFSMPPNGYVLDNQADVLPVYARTRVLVMPSKIETWGRAAIEAACSGIPVVCSPTEGLREAMGDAAIYCARGDQEGWVRALRSLEEADVYWAASLRSLRRARELGALAPVQLAALEAAFLQTCCRRRGRVFTVAGEPQSVDHLAPVVHALPPDLRAPLVIVDPADRALSEAWDYAMASGIVAVNGRGLAPRALDALVRSIADPASSVAVVASWSDHKIVQGTSLKGRTVRLEAGVGQTYAGVESSALPGGPGAGDLLSWLVPGPVPEASVRRAYPSMTVLQVGQPRLDRWSACPRLHPESPLPVVVLCFRGPKGPIPEMSGDFRAFDTVVSTLTRRGEGRWVLASTVHPRFADSVGAWMTAQGIPVLPWVDAVRLGAAMVCDNSSAGFEFAAASRRPTVWLRLPRYRRERADGLRFWDLAIPQAEVTETSLEQQVAQAVGAPDGDPSWRDGVFSVWGSAAGLVRDHLLSHLGTESDQVFVEVLRGTMGQYGMLSRGSRLWMDKQRAESLREKEQVVPVQLRSNPVPGTGTTEPCPIGDPDPGSWWEVTAWTRA